MLAPMITPAAWDKLITPALTNPTTITVVAPLLWMMAVIKAPRATPIRRLEVSIPRNCFILPPAFFCIPSAISFIP